METPVNFAIHGTRPRRWWPSWLLVAVIGSLLTWVGWAVVLLVTFRIAS